MKPTCSYFEQRIDICGTLYSGKTKCSKICNKEHERFKSPLPKSEKSLQFSRPLALRGKAQRRLLLLLRRIALHLERKAAVKTMTMTAGGTSTST